MGAGAGTDEGGGVRVSQLRLRQLAVGGEGGRGAEGGLHLLLRGAAHGLPAAGLRGRLRPRQLRARGHRGALRPDFVGAHHVRDRLLAVLPKPRSGHAAAAGDPRQRRCGEPLLRRGALGVRRAGALCTSHLGGQIGGHGAACGLWPGAHGLCSGVAGGEPLGGPGDLQGLQPGGGHGSDVRLRLAAELRLHSAAVFGVPPGLLRHRLPGAAPSGALGPRPRGGLRRGGAGAGDLGHAQHGERDLRPRGGGGRRLAAQRGLELPPAAAGARFGPRRPGAAPRGPARAEGLGGFGRNG
mmetsp:Transcript_7413/g.17693  ORF Transcript_7413/g.17693 Transcript_7413/m.17693 type:complete len:297 (+) Transcript_7413:928-1818(+)